jgi:hypothetical protein
LALRPLRPFAENGSNTDLMKLWLGCGLASARY